MKRKGILTSIRRRALSFYDFGVNRARLEKIRDSFLENEEIKAASQGR
jgi:uncharacterized protein (DUF1499 family)